MAERRKPIVTELALADALDQLVNLIDELRADADLRVEITTDETDLMKITFSGPPAWAFSCGARCGICPPRSCAASGTRACGTTRSCSAPATPAEPSGPGHAWAMHSPSLYNCA